MIDPLGPIMRSRGVDENDNSEVGELLDAFSRLKRDAGIGELIIAHHSGHGDSGRSRGASVLMDWPDVLVSLDTKGDGGEEGDSAVTRILSAKGRDIDFPRVELAYDTGTHALRATDRKERDDLRRLNGVSFVADLVESSPGITKSAIKAALKEAGGYGGTDAISALLEEAINRVPLRVEKGPYNASLLYLCAD